MEKATIVIFKKMGKFYCTDSDNYNARVQDKNKILDFSSFNSVESIKAYWEKYIHNVDVEFMEA